jgi:hypothetical protein
MVDIVFCSIPYSSLDQIYSGPAILRGVVEHQGYTARTKDFGCTLFNLCDRNTELFDQVQSYFISPGPPSNNSISEILEKFYVSVIDYFLANPSLYIGITVFSVFTHKSTVELLTRIKSSGIQSKIIVGGRGLGMPMFSTVSSKYLVRGAESLMTFSQWLTHKKLVDHTVVGDGEDAVLEILQGSTETHHVNQSDQFKYPLPNYEDYDFNDYIFYDNEIMLPITGSKGCVRNCDFCDVRTNFGKYRYRSGHDIAQEMIDLSKHYNIYKFQFTDSLVNGALKPLEDFLTTISAYNLSNPTQQIRWNGQYICRPQREVANRIPNYYQLLKNSGAEGLTIGAESGSNSVLKAINKKNTVEDLFEELEQFRQHSLTCVILTFTGHWSETWKDFQQHCQMIVKLTPYVRSGTVSAVSLGYPMMMLDGTPATDQAQSHDITFSNFEKTYVWHVKNNPDLTFKERIYRRLLLDQLTKKLRIPTVLNYETHLNLANIVNYHADSINNFYQIHDSTASI